MTSGKIVDTSVWIDFFNDVDGSQTSLIALFIENNELFMLPVILQEVLQGIRDEKTFTAVKKAFLEHPFAIYNNIDMAIDAASLFRFLRIKGVSIRKPNDCLIAAICLNNNFSLLHKDRDFDNIAKYTSLKIYK
ncbi:PIN domain nuclease [soil metagenome]